MTSAPGMCSAPVRAATHPARSLRSTVTATVLVGLALTSCSEPPPAVEEPTGEALERAWRIAVGEDPLDQTLAQIYAMAMNARETPAVVVELQGPPEELAAALAAEEIGTTEDPADQGESGNDVPEDQRYEIVLARTMALAKTLDPEEYARLTAPEAAESIAPAAAPDDLVDLITSELESEEYTGAQLLDPTAAVLTQGLILTSSTATVLELSTEGQPGIQELGEACEELRIGVRNDLPTPAALLGEIYECAPDELTYGSEEELLQQLITAEIDGAVLTSSHPWVVEQALVALADERRAFPQDQYAPLVSSRIADDVPDVVEEISERLDDDSLLTLRRLIDGDQGLAPEEAAEYWLVQQQLVAEPENWG